MPFSFTTHGEVDVGMKNLGDEVHGRRNHGVLLSNGDLQLVYSCCREWAVWQIGEM